jgi:hypothetical protein
MSETSGVGLHKFHYNTDTREGLHKFHCNTDTREGWVNRGNNIGLPLASRIRQVLLYIYILLNLFSS